MFQGLSEPVASRMSTSDAGEPLLRVVGETETPLRGEAQAARTAIAR